MSHIATFFIHPLSLFAIALIPVALSARAGSLRKFIVFNAVAILLFVALFDVVAAGLFMAKERLFRRDHPVYHHGLKPYEDRITRWALGENYRVITNSLGMLDGEPREVPLTPAGRRIVIAGDSFIEGVGFPYEKTIPGIVAGHFSPQGTEVLDAGTVSYSPKLYYLRFKHLLERGLSFNDLYLFIDIGDIQDEVLYAYFVPDPHPASARMETAHLFCYQHSFLFRVFWDHFVIRAENPRSEFSDYWGGLNEHYRVRPMWTYDEKEFDRWGREGLASAIEHADKLWRLLKERGISLHISVHPWREQIARGELDTRQQRAWREFCADRGIDFIDLFPLFINDTPPAQVIDAYFLPSDIHWNEAGLRMVAEELLTRMGPR